MFENFLKSWQILAPLEYKYWLGKRDSLQNYLQRCIHKRGWYYSLEQMLDYVKADVRAKTQTPNQVGKGTECCDEVLLAAYVKALASERAIAPNTVWQHFKGGLYRGVGIAGFDRLALESGPLFFRGNYCIEEDPTKIAELYEDAEGYLYIVRGVEEDMHDRVFYHQDNIGYARKVDGFLELVDEKYPEQEGLLRFQEVVR